MQRHDVFHFMRIKRTCGRLHDSTLIHLTKSPVGTDATPSRQNHPCGFKSYILMWSAGRLVGVWLHPDASPYSIYMHHPYRRNIQTSWLGYPLWGLQISLSPVPTHSPCYSPAHALYEVMLGFFLPFPSSVFLVFFFFLYPVWKSLYVLISDEFTFFFSPS